MCLIVLLLVLVLPQLDIINLLKHLLCVNRKLISLSPLDWSEVDLLLRCCILSILLFPLFFIVQCVQFHNK